ncbi:unnamed protein product [Tetraodon nigroviridis]|uniref:(spotted green pufferfish) hypothetical protein n=1 Tax=Tetraodon nigroviridis TaxID=99883 RepID=Q4SDY8_TETNG|nr:unnamed protein product [Tetraodon nigroviridis]
MGSICLLCTFARLLLWQHVTRGALIIRLPLLASPPGTVHHLAITLTSAVRGQIHT